MATPLLVVGAGRAFEKLYAPALRHRAGEPSSQFDIFAIVEPREERRAWAKRFGRPIYSSVEEALASPTLGQANASAVTVPALVLVPPAAQIDTVSALVDPGVPVLCEKPLATTTAQARLLVDSSRAPVRLALSRRYWSRYRAMAAAIDSPVARWSIELQTDQHAWGAVEPDTSPTALLNDLLPHAYDIATSVLGVSLQVMTVEAGKARVRVELAGHGVIEISYGDVWIEDVKASLSDGRRLDSGAGVGLRLRAAVASRLGRAEPVEAMSMLLEDFALDVQLGRRNEDLIGWAAFREAVGARL